ncbi:MAG TPA: MotA/TolQ/ExbB proton channel family protein [Geminicoccaceae bacterium]|nr:MotA/TolQ/ExbB proton channel family protein [Geminicoccaceae bacterium]
MAYPSVQALMRGHPSPTDSQPGEGASPQPFVAAIMARLRAMRAGGDETAGAQGKAVAGSAASLPRGAPLAFLSRCVVVQAIGAAGLVGLWIAGIANKPFEGDNAFLCWLIVGVAGLGILCVFLQRWRDVEWLATHVVRIGLLGTVVGLIIAFSAAKTGGSADLNEVKPMIAAVVDGMYVSLYSTLLGIATNLWLKINLRLLGHFHG